MGKICSWRRIPLLDCDVNSTRRAQAGHAGGSAKRGGSRDYRGQFRQIAIPNPVYEQRFVMRGAIFMALPIGRDRRFGSPAILTGAKRRTCRRHHKSCNRQQTQCPQQPFRVSNSHRLWHLLITLRRPPACVNLIAPLRKEKPILSRRSRASLCPLPLCPRKSDTRK